MGRRIKCLLCQRDVLAELRRGGEPHPGVLLCFHLAQQRLYAPEIILQAALHVPNGIRGGSLWQYGSLSALVGPDFGCY